MTALGQLQSPGDAAAGPGARALSLSACRRRCWFGWWLYFLSHPEPHTVRVVLGGRSSVPQGAASQTFRATPGLGGAGSCRPPWWHGKLSLLNCPHETT